MIKPMTDLQEKAVNALQVIQDICLDNDCLECPFCVRGRECGITGASPNKWNIEMIDDHWRALI